jgi:hypothetical protein
MSFFHQFSQSAQAAQAGVVVCWLGAGDWGVVSRRSTLLGQARPMGSACLATSTMAEMD